jgi:hypothetical protein
MPQLKLLYHETGTWKRMLWWMMEENITLKNRLTSILKRDIDKTALEELELFQSGFINEDILIGILRKELTELDRLISERPEDKINGTEIDRRHHSLRNHIVIAQKQFSRLKRDFNDCASTLIN